MLASETTSQDLTRESSQAIAQVRWFVGLLFVSFLAFDLALFGHLVVQRTIFPHWIGVSTVGTVMAQVALVSIGVVWGRINLAVRLLLGGTCVLGLACLAAAAAYPADPRTWFGGLLLFSLIMLIPLQCARIRGVCLTIFLRGSDFAFQPSRPPNLRFTIWGLLSTTTVVAIGLTAAKFAEFRVNGMLDDWPVWILIAITACTACGAMFLRQSSSVVKFAVMPVALLALCALGGVGIYYASPPQLQIHVMMLMNLTNGATAALAGLVLRVAGVRLAWRPWKIAPKG